jgi:hypothetical protein
MIEQQPHLHTTSSNLGQRFEEVIGRGVPAHDVELDVHVSFGGADLAWHGRDRLLVVAEEVGLIAANRGKPSQPPVEYHEGVEGRPSRDGQEIVAFRGECAADHLPGGSLLATTAPVNEWAPDQPERQQADNRQEHDQ